jgi:Cys-tRNA(Pro) deacylase
MSKEPNIPVTQAIRVLREKGVAFEVARYDYVEHGGTQRAAAELGVDEHATVKTIVLETDARQPLIVLMHGDREISTKQLARFLGVKSVTPCSPETATRHTGYLVGGTSPFGTRKPLPVYAEGSLFDLPQIWINAGHRGMLVKLAPAVLEQVLQAKRVQVAIP